MEAENHQNAGQIDIIIICNYYLYKNDAPVILGLENQKQERPYDEHRKTDQQFYAREIIQICQPDKPEYEQTRS